MGEAAINQGQQSAGSDPVTDTSSLFQRRIEFHLARKPFSGFISGKNNGGFQLETLNPNSETLKGNGALPGTPKKDALMESNGLDPELSLGIAFRKIMRIGAGLQNLGNTCFLNSVLQCLTYTEPLAAYLESGKHQTSCRMAGFCALCAIQKHVSRALQATGKILAPKDLVSNLRCISRNFRNARQEDAHEYMVNLLESMHKCCLPSGVPSESPSAYEKSLVHKIFGGRLRSQVQCMRCNFCSDKFDPFLDLSLEILKADSLHKALENFTARELLDGGQRQYQCQQCKQKVKANKRLTIDKAPPVLTIHLKRFGSHVPGQKIDKKIHYGPTLDLQKFVSGTYGDELKYTLYGVLVHAGWSTHSGHYYCFVRTSSGNWYSLDDNRVVQVNERKVLEQKAYMLFYVRDRKCPVPRKSVVDVVHKDSMITNGTSNKIYSNHTLRLRDTVPNGFHVKNTESISGAKDERETLNAKVVEETSTKCVVPPKENGVVANGSSASGGPIQLENLPKKPETAAGRKEFPVVDTNNGPSLVKANSTIPLSNGMQLENLLKKPETADGGKESPVLDTNGGPSLVKAKPTLPLSNGVHRFENKGETRSNIPLHNGYVNCKELTCSAALPHSTNGHKQEECNKGSTNSLMAKDISNGSFGDSAGDPDTDVEQRNVYSKSAGVVSQLTMSTSSAKEALGKTCLKAKKKSFKSRVTTMHLSFMILGPASGVHRKKKHKRMKHKIGRKKRCNPSSSDLGPSTSEPSHTLIFSPKPSKKRKSKLGSSEKIYGLDMKTAGDNGNLQKSTVDEVRIERSATELANDKQPQNSTELANNKQPQKSYNSTASVGNQVDTRQSKDSKETKGVITQKGLLNIESSVARWDGVEVPSLDGIEAQDVDSVRIGYIGDEWDDTYDEGRRKKVKISKIEFGGPNPFQEIASKKAVKKVRRSSSANQPFRI